MNCEIFENVLEDHLDGNLDQEQDEQLTAHADACHACQEKLAQEKEFRSLLANYQVPELSPSKAATILRAAQSNQQVDRRDMGFVKGFATAAMLAIFLVVGFFQQKESDIPQVTMQLNEVKAVNLVFNTPEAFADATISMTVPDNFEIDGYGETKVLSWNTSLKKGQNLLSLPLIPISAEQGELVAVISFKDQQKVFKIKLNVESYMDSSIGPSHNFIAYQEA
jgi:hypothetical protein